LSIFPIGGDIKLSAVMPAKAGIHKHEPETMDAGFRRHDNEGKTVIPISGKLL
jgi:hypothetical protein